VLQATALGLAAHQMAGFRLDQARADCQIPEGYEPAAMIAVGYAGDPGLLSEHLRAREAQPRVRKPLSELVYSATWEQPSSLLR
jgi:nitroreductase